MERDVQSDLSSLFKILHNIREIVGFITQANMYGSWKVETTARRMGVELNDYPGSGANNRHTPRPPLGF